MAAKSSYNTRMNMISFLESSDGGFERKLAIAPGDTQGINWFTIFIAANGGRKSLLLRCLTDAALGRRRYAAGRGQSIHLSPPADLPQRVIAISGTPQDRFPRVGTRDLKARLQRSQGDFVYLGPRASNGMSGVAQSERSLVGALVSNRHLLAERAELLARSFSFLGLETGLSVNLEFSAVLDKAAYPKLNEERVLEIQNFAQARGGPEGKELTDSLEKYLSNPLRILEAAKQRLALNRPAFRIGTKLIGSGSRSPLNAGMWELLLRLGHVTVKSTSFRLKNSEQSIQGDRLSSGQWNWLGSFGALVAEMRNGSLILVDEPENSLHPGWQQDFIGELHAIVSKFQDCQVVVATHSPLIASGVSPEWGSLRTLTRPSRAGAFVRSKELPTAFGWAASEVYDEVFGLKSSRSPAFLAVADAALKRLSMGEEISEDQRQVWISQLTEASRALPASDAMRTVLDSVVRRLGSGASRTREGHKKVGK